MKIVEPAKEENIFAALKQHHETVKKDYKPVMTVLVGSQNYGIATNKSDYDTFTFVLPTVRDISMLKDPVSTMVEDDLGHIDIKDIRTGLRLLKKTSPNSVECFATKYRVVEPGYEDMMNSITPYMLRCDTHHMMSAIGGLASQLTKRNMPAGKRLSHVLRMECMAQRYFDVNSDMLSLPDKARELALEAKFDAENPKWESLCETHAERVQQIIREADLNFFEKYESAAIKNIEDLQIALTLKVLDDYGTN